jgi:hypothetical protein
MAVGSMSLVGLAASQACGTSSSESCAQGNSCGDGGVTEQDGAPVTDGTIGSEDGNASDGAPVSDGPVGTEDGGGSDGGGDGAPPCNPADTPSQNACVISDALAVFVSPTGNDTTGAGTMESPVATLGKGITLAQTTGNHRVIACAATYGEVVSLTGTATAAGVALFGGVACPGSDAGAAWTYTGAKAVVAPTEVTLGTSTAALNVLDVSAAVSVTDVEVDAPTLAVSAPAGTSSVAAFVSNAGNVSFARVKLVAASVTAPAVTGLAGATPTTAIPAPENGTDGADGGTAVTCHCANSNADTVGGAGGTDNGPGNAGTPNLGGGTAGLANVTCGNGGQGGNGDNAQAATSGAGATSYGTLTASGWTPAAGLAGASGGPGQGGGGGNSQAAAGVGGGGACGGCGGNPATPGQGGGSSIALLSFASTVTLNGCTLATGNAENGGAGAVGQQGGGGGGGGGANALGGCPGGNGGKGGTGAASGGGAGGLSVGVVWSGTKPTLDSATQGAFTPGTAGTGGTGGAATNGGVSGVAQLTYP